HSLTTRLESSFPTATRDESSSGWTLYHRLLRDVPPPAPSTTEPHAHSHSHQHLLRLSVLTPGRGYSVVQPAGTAADGGGGVITAIPAEEVESYFTLVVNQWSQLWAPQRSLDVVAGATYSVSDVTVRVGELRARRTGMQSAGVNSPGVVVWITGDAGGDVDADGDADGEVKEEVEEEEEEEEVDVEDVRERIRVVWGTIRKGVELGKGEVREVMQRVEGFGGREGEKGTEAVVRMWCEALRPR
ncbi:hypothetical protein CC80DRAFT_376314, partial [Byssothecium circinans]